MSNLFISHSSRDDDFVRELRAALADHGLQVWIDSRELSGGDPLWTEIQKAIDDAAGYVVLVSPDSLQSKWVGKELRYALSVRDERGKDERGKDKFPVVPLSLNGTKLGVLEGYFDDEPVYIQVRGDAGGVEESLNAILVALGKRLPADVVAAAQPKSEPLEELVLELTDLKFHEKDGVRRASARARLVYEPATPGQEEVYSAQSWRLIAPISDIEAEELRWYLEKYAIWPSHYFRERARKVEENLVKWGQLLYEAAMPAAHTADVLQAWARIGDDADRRFSVYVDAALEAGAPEDEVKAAKEAGTLLLALPWELLHDGDGFLFQGAKPMRVRRRLPKTKVLAVPVVATPIRILLVTARPEDDECGYLDHRTSALPLVEAMESLPGLVKMHVLSPPTLPALRAELERARNEKKPYHVVHFNGHGVFDGEGGLCFEHPEDSGKLENRRHVTVHTSELGPLLRDHRIPLVFLEVCQTAQAEKASESVASELLRVGVASVVAMSHSVLVETSRRFVEAFYIALAAGQRVGDAMLAGQRALKDDTFRERIFGAGELRLEDWFVPVLYQEKDDPQLFKITPAKQTQEDFKARLAARLGNLPPVPETGFIGRSRELLALQRLLRKDRYAVVRGQVGEGKTALAAEFARWMIRSQQIHRAAFVSVETFSNQRAIVDALGKQLVNKEFSAAGDLNDAIQQVERALREQPSLLVIDKMESVLLPPFIARATPDALSDDKRKELEAILALCERLLKAGETRIVFTTREVLPQPFSDETKRRELDRLNHDDAVKLVERVLNAAGHSAGASSDIAREEIEQFVNSVHGHTRSLALLAPALREHGVEASRESPVELMANFSRSRDKSVFASVELSLQRMSQVNRERARVLGVFHGGIQLRVLSAMTQWKDEDVDSLANELIETGLAKLNPYDHLTLNPALCPYLRGTLDPAERDRLTGEWVSGMREYVEGLVEQQRQNIELASTLTLLELPNLFALLEIVQRTNDAEATIDLATALYQLLQLLGKPALLKRLGQVRDAAAAALGDTLSHAQFEAARSRIEQQLSAGEVGEALEAARKLHDRVKNAGEQAYPVADFDIAYACFTLGRALNDVGDSEQALLLLDESRQRFEAISKSGDRDADEKVSLCFSEKGECLRQLGQFDEAVAAYEEGIRRDMELGDVRGIAVGKSQIGSIRGDQGRYDEALEALAEARARFAQLDEPDSLAIVWHQIGNVYHEIEDYEAAEDAYRNALALEVQLGDVSGQAKTLTQLGMTYDSLERYEEAVAFYQQAVDKSVEQSDIASEGLCRHNLAETLRKLERFDEARQEIRRTIECKSEFGHASKLWLSWAVVEEIETDTGNAAAAADAKRQAITCYLSYRRDGGENPYDDGSLSLDLTEYLLAGNNAAAASLLEEVAADPELSSDMRTFINALQAIVAGSRDRTLADSSDLDYGMAAEILFLIETLENQASGK